MTSVNFELEQAIFAAWKTKEDLDLFIHQFKNSTFPMTQEQIIGFIEGLSVLHNARCARAFDLFEQLLAQKFNHNCKGCSI